MYVKAGLLTSISEGRTPLYSPTFHDVIGIAYFQVYASYHSLPATPLSLTIACSSPTRVRPATPFLRRATCKRVTATHIGFVASTLIQPAIEAKPSPVRGLMSLDLIPSRRFLLATYLFLSWK